MSNVILFRLLTPEDFGLFVIPLVVISFVRILQDFGFTTLVVRSNELSYREVSSIFWFVGFSGLLFACLVFLISPLVSSWTQEPSSAEINRYLSITVFFTGLYAVQESIIRKKLDFKRLFIVDSFSGILSSAAGIMAAIGGMGFHSLTLKYISMVFISMIGFQYYSRWRPGLIFESSALKKNLHYHLPISGEQILNFAQRNIDNVLISRFLGTISMGLYDRAYRILMFPLQQISNSFGKVMLPAFSRIQHDRAKIGHYHLMVCRFVALVSFPLMVGIFCTAPYFVRVVFGHQWLDIIPLVKVFSILGLFQSIGTLSLPVFQSTGDTSLLFRLSLFSKTLMLIAISIGVLYYKNINAVAVCYLCASLIAFIPESFYVCKSVRITVSKFIFNLLPFFTSAVVMGSVINLLLSLAALHLNDLWVMLVMALIGAVVYFSILILIKDKTLTEVRALLTNRK